MKSSGAACKDSLGRIPVTVWSVGRSSAIGHTLHATNGFTGEKPYEYRECGKTFHYPLCFSSTV